MKTKVLIAIIIVLLIAEAVLLVLSIAAPAPKEYYLPIALGLISVNNVIIFVSLRKKKKTEE